MSAEPVDLRPEGGDDRDSGAATRGDLVLADTPDIGVGNRTFSPLTVDEAFALLDAELREETAENVRRARAEATLRAYRRAWGEFEEWCIAKHFVALPAEPLALAAFLTDLGRRGQKVATIHRKLSAISVVHRKAGYDSPRKAAVVADAVKGIANRLGQPQVQKAPARKGDLCDMLATLDTSRLIGARDCALLAIGFAGAFRRSELVALDVSDLSERADWLYVTIRRSKSDQSAKGAKVALPWAQKDPALCPIRAWRRWLAVSGITEGPAFRPITKGGVMPPNRLSSKAVAAIVKRTAAAAGLNPDSYAGHSLRRGFITSAAEEHVLERKIMQQSRHRSPTVMRGYIDDVDLTVDNAAAAIL